LNGANSIQAPPEPPARSAAPRELKLVVGGRLSRGWRQARRIFHVLVGLAFFFFAAAGASVALAEWRSYAQTPANGVWRFAVISGFSALLMFFGVYSLVRARSVR